MCHNLSQLQHGCGTENESNFASITLEHSVSGESLVPIAAQYDHVSKNNSDRLLALKQIIYWRR